MPLHVFSFYIKVLVIRLLSLISFFVWVSSHSEIQALCKNPLLFPLTLRVKLQSPSLAHNAPIILTLTVCPSAPRCTQIHHRLFWTISSSQNNLYVLYASCPCNILFFSVPITSLYLPPVLPSELPLILKLTQEFFLLGGNCSWPLGLNYVSLCCALIASGKTFFLALTTLYYLSYSQRGQVFCLCFSRA